MPIAGRIPKPDGMKRNRAKPAFDWIIVENKPYDGPVPYECDVEWSLNTCDWWRVITKMPHCILWDDADWRFAYDTAWVVQELNDKFSASTAIEKRTRECMLGMTWDSRRGLRIRYVDEVEPATDDVTTLNDYRNQLSA